MSEIEVEQQQALDRYLELTAIRGGSGDEQAVANAIVAMLVDAGLDREAIRFDGAEQRTRLKGNCGNLIAHLPGTGDGPRTLLSAHMDTVPICLGSEPVVDGSRVVSRGPTGLGADDRSGCAAVVTAAVERLRSGRTDLPPAVLLLTVQEEIGLEGAQALDVACIGPVDRAYNFDGSIVEKVTVGAIGGERIRMLLRGVPSHAGSAPERGASAIVMASRAIARLDAEGWLGRVEKSGGVGTANIGVIRGGEATNVITPEVELRAEARSHDAEFRTQIVATIRSAFEQAVREVTNIDGAAGACDFESHVEYEAFRLADDDPSVIALEEVLRSIGRQPFREVVNGGLDANWLFRHGISAVTVGCGQVNIHTADEELDVPQYLAACEVATRLITLPAAS